ncbi:hypothetical protein [Geomonas anaerohicana]|uniref:Uncharacterized protein n=1 Tax=Geomonas anaerohicana TaxID=2798583 RepID=A0ABS0YGQ2_9BACT|nr:hypothetical protein [Geomonas anaerohicana]MBJ6751480.1 hypothetical protein [Geomonas anaerohicana]
MSAVVTFEIMPSNNDSAEIQLAITEIWHQAGIYKSVEVIPSSNPNSYYIVLSFFLGKNEERESIRKIITYLISKSCEGKVFYFRDGFGDYPDFNETITIDELLSAKYEPSLSTEEHWRYQVVSGQR